jgi:hypothetical protein
MKRKPKLLIILTKNLVFQSQNENLVVSNLNYANLFAFEKL